MQTRSLIKGTSIGGRLENIRLYIWSTQPTCTVSISYRLNLRRKMNKHSIVERCKRDVNSERGVRGSEFGHGIAYCESIAVKAFSYKYCHCWRCNIQPSVSVIRSKMGRFLQAAKVSSELFCKSAAKSAVSLSAVSRSNTARLTSSFKPKERLSKLVDPTTDHSPSTIRAFT